MGSPRKTFSKGYQTVKNDFQEAVSNLFEKQHNGTKCNNAIFITILLGSVLDLLQQPIISEIPYVYDQPYGDFVHFLRLGKTNALAHQPTTPRPQR